VSINVDPDAKIRLFPCLRYGGFGSQHVSSSVRSQPGLIPVFSYRCVKIKQTGEAREGGIDNIMTCSREAKTN